MENPVPKFFRLKPGGEVRLMGAYIVKCNEVVKDDAGNVVELKCTADLETGNGNPVDGRKIKGTIHWVSARHAIPMDVMLYDYLFTLEDVNDVPEGTNYLDYLNPDSLQKLTGCIDVYKRQGVRGASAPGRPSGSSRWRTCAPSLWDPEFCGVRRRPCVPSPLPWYTPAICSGRGEN